MQLSSERDPVDILKKVKLDEYIDCFENRTN